MDDDPLDADAALSGLIERADDDAIGDEVDVGTLVDVLQRAEPAEDLLVLGQEERIQRAADPFRLAVEPTEAVVG